MLIVGLSETIDQLDMASSLPFVRSCVVEEEWSGLEKGVRFSRCGSMDEREFEEGMEAAGCG